MQKTEKLWKEKSDVGISDALKRKIDFCECYKA